MRVACTLWLARLPIVPVLVHVPVHGFRFSNLGSPLDHPREHRFLVNGNVNRFAVNVNVWAIWGP